MQESRLLQQVFQSSFTLKTSYSATQFRIYSFSMRRSKASSKKIMRMNSQALYMNKRKGPQKVKANPQYSSSTINLIYVQH